VHAVPVARAASVPAQTRHGGVAAEIAAGRMQYRRAQFLDDLSGVQVCGVAEGGRDVEDLNLRPLDPQPSAVGSGTSA
jgi:hypothetical protein